MTIKEAEEILGVPRATIRFYEKEKLLNPQREENGYRDYSNEDIEKLKKIIILRKLGFAVTDIEDLFDGAKDIPEVLESNILSLEHQMEELQGALKVCREMQQEQVCFSGFDSERYWKIIDEEEKKGNKFMDLAKDFVQMEKGVINSWFGWTDENGELYNSPIKVIFTSACGLSVFGLVRCLIERTWTLKCFVTGAFGFFSILLLECILCVPFFFLGRKNEWIRKNIRKCVFWANCVLFLALLILLFFLQ